LFPLAVSRIASEGDALASKQIGFGETRQSLLALAAGSTRKPPLRKWLKTKGPGAQAYPSEPGIGMSTVCRRTAIRSQSS